LTVLSVVVLISFALYLVEVYGMILSSSFLFRFGVKVKTMPAANFNLDRFEIGKGYTTEHAKFTRINTNSCVFCHRFGFFRVNTPFPIKGEIVQNDSETQLIWRIPLGSTLFFSLWLLGWLSPLVGMLQLITGGAMVDNLAFSLLIFFGGILGACFLLFYSAWLEQKRARLALSELMFYSLHK
jgi:hypothetical protein